MSKTNDTPSLPTHDLGERQLRDDELEKVSGGQQAQVTKMEWGPVSFDIGL